MNSLGYAFPLACMTSPNSEFVSYFKPEVIEVSTIVLQKSSKTQTHKFYFSPSSEKKVFEITQRIFTAIGQGDAKTLSEILKDPLVDTTQTALVNFVITPLPLTVEIGVTISSLSAAAIVGSTEMVTALLGKASSDNLANHLKNFQRYYKHCHVIILQYIENSALLDPANDARKFLEEKLKELERKSEEAKTHPTNYITAFNNHNLFSSLAIERLTEIKNIISNASRRRKEMINAHIPVADLVPIIEEYAPLY